MTKIEELAASIRRGLNSIFLGQPSANISKEIISLQVKKMLARQEADLYGYKIDRCQPLWDMWTLKEKAKWFLWNRLIPSKGDAARLRIDLDNLVAMHEWDRKIEEFHEREPEEELFVDYYESKSYPDFLILNPKGIIKIEATIKLNQPLEFIGISLQLDDLKKD